MSARQGWSKRSTGMGDNKSVAAMCYQQGSASPAACFPCGCLRIYGARQESARQLTAVLPPVLALLYCRMEYVLHPDPNGPHPVDGWPGNPWIYQVGLHCTALALPCTALCSPKPARACPWMSSHGCGCLAAGFSLA